jgi:tetratricopeptide (TPR) repeat protein
MGKIRTGFEVEQETRRGEQPDDSSLLRSGGASYNFRAMTLSPVLVRVWWFVLLPSLVLTGCLPTSRTELQEEKDPHYLTGKSRVHNKDFDAAIEAFEKALENNPRSAAAHLELGILYEQRRNDFATAIYHYQKHLQFRPDSNVADSVAERINSCKLQLVATVPYALINREVQSEIARLNQENNSLKQQVEQLRAQIAVAQAAPATAAAPSSRPLASPAPSSAPPPAMVSTPPSTPRFAETFGDRADSGRSSARFRRHTIQSGDTVFNLSRRYNVSVDAILSANPGLQPTRLLIGQAINIPPP